MTQAQPPGPLNGIVTLLTDFGTQDGYAAAMKGVILEQAPQACIVDAAHDIPPQDVRYGAWCLRQYAPCYPGGTLHVGVVDPGVGTQRAILCIFIDGQYYLLPDNGLSGLVLQDARQITIRKLHPDWHRPDGCSSTFHGRDIFAFAAGRMLVDPAALTAHSTPCDSLLQPSWSACRRQADCITGEIIHTDHFGNLVTNITAKDIDALKQPGESVEIMCGNTRVHGIRQTYAEMEAGEKLALIGSHGCVELAVRNGSARDTWQVTRGEPVIIRMAPGGHSS